VSGDQDAGGLAAGRVDSNRSCRRVGRGGLIAFALAAAWLAGAGADWRAPGPGEGPEALAIRSIEGQGYVGVNDLARVLDATKFWRADTRRLVLRAGSHALTFTVDNPFVVVDGGALLLPTPVRSLRGEIQVPVALLERLPSDSLVPKLYVNERRRRVLVLPASGGVGSPVVSASEGITRVSFAVDRAEQVLVVERSRAHFRLRFGGIFTGETPDSFPPASLMRGLRSIGAAGGSAFELTVAPEAAGFRLLPDVEGRRVTLELVRDEAPDLEAFAPEGPPGPRRLRVIVLDPGHGGVDLGVVAGDAVEKDLALALARDLKGELERRLNARVVLTRSTDRPLTAVERAEIANRARADLVISLHLDGFADAGARGATAYCPPATFAPEPGHGDDRAAEPLVMLPWRDVATRHAVQSRALAEAVLSALELRGQGPTRLREQLSYNLLGVNAPGLLLECATLTSPQDRERVMQKEGLRELAASIAEGVAAYQLNP
jgi:N-acetylmuramoyl-L-alanine amidase